MNPPRLADPGLASLQPFLGEPGFSRLRLLATKICQGNLCVRRGRLRSVGFPLGTFSRQSISSVRLPERVYLCMLAGREFERPYTFFGPVHPKQPEQILELLLILFQSVSTLL